MLIARTERFDVVSAERPHVDRLDGGHVKIVPRFQVVERTELEPDAATELMLLTMIVGDAMKRGLDSRGIEIGRINYQDNGNWGVFRPQGPHLHIHLYGRAKSAPLQRYGDALFLPQRETGFYENTMPLEHDDVRAISEEILSLLTTEKYRDLPPVSLQPL